jgi:hypothetical protein
MIACCRPSRLFRNLAILLCMGWWACGLTRLAAAERSQTQSSVWLISTRQARYAGPCGDEVPELTYHELDRDNNCWRSVCAADFPNKVKPKLPTIFVVHGNRYKADEVVEDAWPVYAQLEADKKPYRLVIWSWPSEQVCRRRRPDTQLKAQRTELESLYLARCLNHFDRDVPLNLVGFSFGSRIITGTLHLLGGGQLARHSLQHRSPKSHSSINAILIAAAVDSDWLLPDHYHGKALSQLNRLLVTCNCCDTALRWYPAMYHRRGPPALGFVGPECCGLELADQERMEVLDLSCDAGKTHDWRRYFAVCSLQERLSSYTFTVAMPPVNGHEKTARHAKQARSDLLASSLAILTAAIDDCLRRLNHARTFPNAPYDSGLDLGLLSQEESKWFNDPLKIIRQ